MEKNKIRYSDTISVKDQVVITSVISEKVIYICNFNADLEYLQNSVRKLSKKAQKVKVLPKADDLVLAQYLEDVFRARVVRVSDSSVVVKLIDFGNSAMISIEDVLEMPAECQKLDRYTHKVLLKDVEVESLSWELVSFLLKLIQEKEKFRVESLEGNRIVLVNKLSDYNLNERIIELCAVHKASASFDDASVFDVSVEPLQSHKDSKIFCFISGFSKQLQVPSRSQPKSFHRQRKTSSERSQLRVLHRRVQLA